MAPADSRSERGAITIHVAVALIALLAFSSIVIDYGVMWVSRRQAQNAADAGALAGAISLARDAGTTAMARLSAEALAANNVIWGELNVAGGAGANIVVAASGTGAGEDSTIQPCLTQPGCVRVDVLRNQPSRAGGSPVGAPLPTFFSNMVGIGAQGVRATATARVRAGNQVRCLLPFAVIDRWADDTDLTVDPAFPSDGTGGTAGWSPTDLFEQAPLGADVYVPPYGTNASHTGWRVIGDYGRQLVLKDSVSGIYPAGRANVVNLPGTTVAEAITGCNPQPVGVATASACTGPDEARGCVQMTTGIAAHASDISALVGSDAAASWSAAATGPGSQLGAVVGGNGMESVRIRPLAVLDINRYSCAGGGCLANVANIIGFFVEGVCGAATLDPGLTCTTGDIVGRIMTIPGTFATGTGTVDETASFVRAVQLVR